jgi:hypothetical protein
MVRYELSGNKLLFKFDIANPNNDIGLAIPSRQLLLRQVEDKWECLGLGKDEHLCLAPTNTWSVKEEYAKDDYRKSYQTRSLRPITQMSNSRHWWPFKAKENSKCIICHKLACAEFFVYTTTSKCTMYKLMNLCSDCIKNTGSKIKINNCKHCSACGKTGPDLLFHTMITNKSYQGIRKFYLHIHEECREKCLSLPERPNPYIWRPIKVKIKPNGAKHEA